MPASVDPSAPVAVELRVLFVPEVVPVAAAPDDVACDEVTGAVVAPDWDVPGLAAASLASPSVVPVALADFDGAAWVATPPVEVVGGGAEV